MYFLNFLDRNAMVNGKLNSLSEDLKLKGTEYNTCISILFVGYDPSDDSVYGAYTDPDDQIPSWPSTFQHASQSNPAFLVYGRVYDGLGNCLYSHMSGQRLPQHARM